MISYMDRIHILSPHPLVFLYEQYEKSFQGIRLKTFVQNIESELDMNMAHIVLKHIQEYK